jgi:transposase
MSSDELSPYSKQEENSTEFNMVEEQNQEQSKINTRRITLGEELRVTIISMYLQGDLPAKIDKNISRIRSTVYNVIRNLKNENRINSLKRGGDRRSILTSEQKEMIISWVDDDPTITLKKLVVKVEDQIGLKIDDNTVDRVLKGYNYTLKQILPIPERRNNSSTIETRYNYAISFNEILF